MRARVSLFVVLAALCAALALPQLSYAAVQPLDTVRLAGMADSIVEVQVRGTGSRAGERSPDSVRATPLTDVRLRVVRVLKGAPPAEFTLTQPGGSMDGLTLEVPDLPRFTPGERCVLFLDGKGVIGGSQGKLEIVDGAVPEWGVSLGEARVAIEAALGGRRFEGPLRAPAARFAAIGDALGLSAGNAPVASASASVAAGSAGSVADGADGVVPLAPVTLLDSTFEGGSTAGWSMSGAPTWAATSYRAQAGTYSLYGSGAGTGGRAAPGPVTTNAVYAEAVRTSPVNLAGYNTATLEWDVYTDMTADSYNWVNVELANSLAGPWYMPGDTFEMGDSGGWQHYAIDLRDVTDYWGAGTHDFTGDTAVYVRLVFAHSVGSADEGAYVDNVRLVAESISSPVIDSISPDSANGGVHDVITITGSDFGDTRGAGKVEFLAGNSTTGARVAVDTYYSWSDTQIVCEVPRRAQSGPVWVTDGVGAASTGYEFHVGFSTSGLYWPDLPASFSINENCPDMTGEGAQVQAAMATWNGAGSNFRVQAAGTSGQTVYPPNSGDGNHIYWTTDPDFPTAYLGMNYYWFNGSGQLVESDIVFDDTDTWVNGGIGGQWDVQTVALHELGHAVHLDDQYGDNEYAEVMASAPYGTTRRALSQAEIDGAVYLYGTDGSTAPAAPMVLSVSHASSSAWYSDPDLEVSFSSAGAAGYSYVLDRSATTIPDTTSEGAATTRTYAGLADGVWYFHVRAVSAGGTWGATTHKTVRIDTVAPVTSGTVPSSGTMSVTFTLSATDAGSGVDSIVYRIDGGPETEYTGAVQVTEIGEHQLTYRAEDNAGNDESEHVATFSVLPRGDIELLSVEGADRFATAVESSQLGFPGGAGTVLVATGRNWPDALGASALAGALDAPILLTERWSVPAVVAAEIDRLGATRAIIIGGLGAVDDDVETVLRSTGSIAMVERIAGTDRYDTARKVASRAVEAGGSAYDGTVLVATGGSYADALAASPIAAANGWPILLVAPGAGLPDATLELAERIGERGVALGGNAAVSYDAFADLVSVFGANVDRIAGSDRFDTAARIAEWGTSACGMDWAHPAIATGRSPYDALAGGVVQGRSGSVLLLTEPTTLPAKTAECVSGHEPDILEVRFFGGVGAVSQAVRDEVCDLLGMP